MILLNYFLEKFMPTNFLLAFKEKVAKPFKKHV